MSCACSAATNLTRAADATIYVWDHRRRMFGRPIMFDVLGSAPIARLGERRRPGPLSIVAAGALVGFVARVRVPGARIRSWMLVLVIAPAMLGLVLPAGIIIATAVASAMRPNPHGRA